MAKNTKSRKKTFDVNWSAPFEALNVNSPYVDLPAVNRRDDPEDEGDDLPFLGPIYQSPTLKANLNDALDYLDELDIHVAGLEEQLFGQKTKAAAVKDLGESIHALTATTKTKSYNLLISITRLLNKL
jgi:hypothetical protein